MHGSRRGSQTPTWSLEPSGVTDWSLSDLAVEWAAEVGYELDEWQQYLVRWVFARRADGLWAARDVGHEVPRQNGKNIVLEVVELFAVCMLGEDLVIHSAHRTDVSHEHFLSLKARIELSPMLSELMPDTPNGGFYTVNGRESIELANGNRILFKSRQSGSGRGPRPKRLVFDEALILPISAVGDMAPGMSAQRNAQIVFASSPPKADSAMLHLLRQRAKDGHADRLFYAAWNNSPDVDPDDRDAWYRVNPSLGYGRMTEESLQANRQLMSHEDYVREHLGVPEVPASQQGPIDGERWRELVDGDSLPTDGSLRLCLDVPPARTSAVFSIAGRRADNLFHGSVRYVVPPPEMRRLVEIAGELAEGHGVPLILPPNSPAKAWRAQLVEAGVELDELTPAEYAEACGSIMAAISDGSLRHRGQPELDAAVGGLASRSSGDVETWSRRSSSANISPFVALTCAFGRVPQPVKKSKQANAWAFVGS
jgi:phage terminase large subunit-like protein